MMFGKNTNDLSVDELRHEIQLNKERIAEWTALVNKFGDRLKELDREHDHLASEESRLQAEVEGKKQLLADSTAELAQVDEEIREAHKRSDVSAVRRLEMEQKAATMKAILDNMIQAEFSLQRDAAAKREALANEFEPQHATRVAQERLLTEETMAMHHDVDQLNETIETMHNKEEARQADVAHHREKLGTADAKLQELRQALKEKQDEHERKQKDLAAEVAKRERMLHESDQELRDKIFSLVETNRELEKVEKDLSNLEKSNQGIQQNILNERQQIRSLEMALVEIESKRQDEFERLSRLTAELEEAKANFKRKSKELAEMTEREQQASLEYMSKLESELGDAAAEEDRARSSTKPAKEVDPEFEKLHAQVTKKVTELTLLKREHERNLEEARQQHCRRKAQIEVSNNNLSDEQRFLQLDQAYRKELAQFERQKSYAELKLSEATSQLAALQAEVSTQLAGVAPNLWKMRDTIKDNEQFEQAINKMTKQKEMSLKQSETRLKLLSQQKVAIVEKLAQITKNCEVMQQQLAVLQTDRKRQTRKSDDPKGSTGQTSNSRIPLPGRTGSAFPSTRENN